MEEKKKTTLTREQRLSLIEAYETEGNNAWDVADLFKQMRPKTYRRLLKKACKEEGISIADVDNPESQVWVDMYDHSDFWQTVKDLIFEKCDIVCAGYAGYCLKEEITDDDQ